MLVLIDLCKHFLPSPHSEAELVALHFLVNVPTRMDRPSSHLSAETFKRTDKLPCKNITTYNSGHSDPAERSDLCRCSLLRCLPEAPPRRGPAPGAPASLPAGDTETVVSTIAAMAISRTDADAYIQIKNGLSSSLSLMKDIAVRQLLQQEHLNTGLWL